MKHWTDTFFAGFWGEMQRGTPMVDTAPDEARTIRHILRLRAGSRVADIPCGDGRIALELARAGCVVTGVDRRVASIRRARGLFRAAGQRGTFHVGDMRALSLGEGFDAVVNWWGSFGYFDDATNLEVLRGFARIVVPGGRVLVDQVNRERVLRQFMKSHVSEDGGLRVSVRNRWDARRQRIEGSWTFQRGSRRQTARSSIRLYTPLEMKTLMDAAGLKLERIVDGKTGLPLTRSSRRMTAVGRRRR
ncbi:MAG: class I SAM-dependent methyltransferase [Candidatus Eisenbacteria bacterium]|nr:class I SAM-dependent methyltransferase [Candidatus Eisenbacteria bacterium]